MLGVAGKLTDASMPHLYQDLTRRQRCLAAISTCAALHSFCRAERQSWSPLVISIHADVLLRDRPSASRKPRGSMSNSRTSSGPWQMICFPSSSCQRLPWRHSPREEFQIPRGRRPPAERTPAAGQVAHDRKALERDLRAETNDETCGFIFAGLELLYLVHLESAQVRRSDGNVLRASLF